MSALRPTVLACLLCTAAATAQERAPQAAPPMSAEMRAMMAAWEKAATPGAPHRQLAEHFVGTWDAKSTVWMDPSAPPASSTGRAVNTAVLGGRQIRMEYRGEVMGQPFEGVGYTGYDNVRGRYQGSWLDSMSTGQFLAEGEYDPGTRTYTFRGQMPDPMKPGATTAVRELVRIVDADHHVMEFYETHGGKERKSMQIEYSRVE